MQASSMTSSIWLLELAVNLPALGLLQLNFKCSTQPPRYIVLQRGRYPGTAVILMIPNKNIRALYRLPKYNKRKLIAGASIGKK